MAAKKDLPVINLTRAEAEAIDADRIELELVPRLSLGHCKSYLVREIEAGNISVSADVIKAWTYGAIIVKGVDGEKVPGKKEALQTLTAAQFGKLSAKEVAGLVRDHTTEKRASCIVTALMTEAGLRPEPADLVYLSNGRMSIEGFELQRTTRVIDTSILIKGVKINGKTAEEEDE